MVSIVTNVLVSFIHTMHSNVYVQKYIVFSLLPRGCLLSRGCLLVLSAVLQEAQLDRGNKGVCYHEPAYCAM